MSDKVNRNMSTEKSRTFWKAVLEDSNICKTLPEWVRAGISSAIGQSVIGPCEPQSGVVLVDPPTTTSGMRTYPSDVNARVNNRFTHLSDPQPVLDKVPCLPNRSQNDWFRDEVWRPSQKKEPSTRARLAALRTSMFNPHFFEDFQLPTASIRPYNSLFYSTEYPDGIDGVRGMTLKIQHFAASCANFHFDQLTSKEESLISGQQALNRSSVWATFLGISEMSCCKGPPNAAEIACFINAYDERVDVLDSRHQQELDWLL